MIKIIAVKYLNTLPFVHGIENSGFLKDYSLQLDIPSACAKRLLNEDADIGLVPIASLKDLSDYTVFSDYCIGALKSVGSVLLLADKPIDQLTKIYLDYQSKTTNLLVQVILNKYLDLFPLWSFGEEGFEQQISGNTGGVVIGDRALHIREKFSYKYDLATLWNKHTGLPFVFACWVAKPNISKSILANFNEALKWGVEHKYDAIKDTEINIDLEQYFDKAISYEFDSNKKEAMNRYLSETRTLSVQESSS